MTKFFRRLALAGLGVAASLATASPALAQGATTPFVTYEAEEGTLGGGATVRTLAAPLTTWSDTPRPRRRAVRSYSSRTPAIR